jgi:hypothetical protein
LTSVKSQKLLTVFSLLILLSITVAPTINFNVVKASQDNDLVEVTSQACGIQGYGNTTVQLTKQQYNDLEQYLVDFRARSNQTSTRQEAVPLFKDAVVELDKYGLLPKGMSVERAQKLVIGENNKEGVIKFAKKLFSRNQNGSHNNSLCLIAGYINQAAFISLFELIPGLLLLPLYFIVMLFGMTGYYFYFPPGLINLIILLELPMNYGAYVKPINPMSVIVFGKGGNTITTYSTGSIYSLGLLGMKYVKGNFTGSIIGFTGIRIPDIKKYGESPPNYAFGDFFLGSALLTKINDYP